MPARLILAAGDSEPVIHYLPADRLVTLGRNHANTIVLQDRYASRRHAEIACQDGQWVLRDCDTVNGTRVNGQRIDGPTVLSHGQEIGIGDLRLRFRLDAGEDGTADMPALAAPADAPSVVLGLTDFGTALNVDELAALCAFMTAAAGETAPCTLVEKALQTVHAVTRAVITGFLSLDPDDPLPRMVLPATACVDVPLSRQLTHKVQRDGRPVWLHATPSEISDTDSLISYQDAVCVPLRAGTAPLGALHVYKSGKTFTEREVRFCELVAGYLAAGLGMLRSRRSLEAENRRLRDHTVAPDDLLVGDSPAIVQLRQHVTRVAGRPCTALIVGESGVGKELVALSLHNQSPRRDGPLVPVNCAAIAATLPEAELFGHCKGAFTGADRDRAGYFQQADEGTLFLDEIGELPLEMQAKLLRVLESKRFRPVGATADVHVDVRVIVATNRDLEREVREGRFRQDLYYRLGVPLRVPPLREHPEDMPLLVRHFLSRLAVEYRRPLDVTDAALRCLQAYSWPGNVRQLRSVLENAVAMSDDDLLDVHHLPLPSQSGAGAEPPATLNLEELEAWAIRQALQRTTNNVTHAAKLLGIHRDTLTNKLKKYGIDK
jgi:transcriptional regulator with GAF, ATPase, and Fis domain